MGTHILTHARSKTEAARDLIGEAITALHRANEVSSSFVAQHLIDNAECLLRRASELLLLGDSLRATELADELAADPWARTLTDIAAKVSELLQNNVKAASLVEKASAL